MKNNLRGIFHYEDSCFVVVPSTPSWEQSPASYTCNETETFLSLPNGDRTR